MTPHERLPDLIKSLEAHAKRVLVGTKDSLSPLMHVITRSHGDGIIAIPDGREALPGIPAVLADLDAVAYGFAYEGWMIARQTDTGERPSECDDREEVVVIGATDGVASHVLALQIKRGPDGGCAALVKDPRFCGDDGRHQSRWFGLLPASHVDGHA